MRIGLSALSLTGFAALLAAVPLLIAAVALFIAEVRWAWIVMVSGQALLFGGFVLLFIQALVERLRNKEDSHYSRNVHH